MTLARPLALGLGLAGNGADHRFVDIDVLDLDHRHLDAPGVGLLVEALLDVLVEPLALGEQGVQLVPAEHRAQRRLRQLRGRFEEVGDLDHRPLRIDDAEIKHGIDLDRHVVAGDHVLAGHVHGDHPQIDTDDLLDERDDDDQPRPLDLPETAEHEDDAALVFEQDAKRRHNEHEDYHPHRRKTG
jgi:hypothetical protein